MRECRIGTAFVTTAFSGVTRERELSSFTPRCRSLKLGLPLNSCVFPWGLPLRGCERFELSVCLFLPGGSEAFVPLFAWLGTLSQNYLRHDIRRNAARSVFAFLSNWGSVTCRRCSVYFNAERASNFPFASQLTVADARFPRMLYLGTVAEAYRLFELSIEALIEPLLPFRFLGRDCYSQGMLHVLRICESELAPRIPD